MIALLKAYFSLAMNMRLSSNMEISQKGIDLVKKFEGFSPTPYKCPAGKNTIGYGHAFTSARQILKITKNDAEKLLKRDLRRSSRYIEKVVKVELTQGQFDALCSLVFNWGAGAFRRSKGLKELNSENYKNAKAEFFSKSKGVVYIQGVFSNGLYRRRKAEERLWNDKTCQA